MGKELYYNDSQRRTLFIKKSPGESRVLKIMSAKMKALGLIGKFDGSYYALMCVNEMISYSRDLEREYQEDMNYMHDTEEYLEKVKQEIMDYGV